MQLKERNVNNIWKSSSSAACTGRWPGVSTKFQILFSCYCLCYGQFSVALKQCKISKRKKPNIYVLYTVRYNRQKSKLLKISEKSYLDLIIFQDKFLIILFTEKLFKGTKRTLNIPKKINISNPLNVSIVELHLELKTVMVMSSKLFEKNHGMET